MGGTPIAGWFIMENPNFKIDDFGVIPEVPLFQETTIWNFPI